MGQGVFWSSAKEERAYPIPLRVLSFEDRYGTRDPAYSKPPVGTFAARLKAELAAFRDEVRAMRDLDSPEAECPPPGFSEEDEGFDNMALEEAVALSAVRRNTSLTGKLNGREGAAWGAVLAVIKEALPSSVADADRRAYDLVVPTMNAFFSGIQDVAWHSDRRPSARDPSRKARRIPAASPLIL